MEQIREEELRDGALPQIREQYNPDQNADGNVTSVLRKHRPSRRGSFTGSVVSGRDVPAVYPEDLRPQQRRDTLEVPSQVHHRPSSTTSRVAPTKSLQLNYPLSFVDEIRGVDLVVEGEAVLSEMDEPIAREATSVSKTNASAIEDKDLSFWQLLRKGNSSKFSISTFKKQEAGQLNSGKSAVDENMAGLDELSNPDQNLQNQRCDNDDIGELNAEKTHNFSTSDLAYKGDSDDLQPQFSYRNASEGKTELEILDYFVEERLDYVLLEKRRPASGGGDTPTHSTSAESSKPKLTYAQRRKSYFSKFDSVTESDMDKFGDSFNPEVNLSDNILQDGGDNDDLEITVAQPSGYEDLFPEELDRGLSEYTPPSPLQSTKATNPAPPLMKRASNRPTLTEAGASISFPPSTRAGPSKSDRTPFAPIAISNQAVPLTDDLEIHELSDPKYDSWLTKAARGVMRYGGDGGYGKYKIGEKKADRKKARYCGPAGSCLWILCLPCIVIEVAKWGGFGVLGRVSEGYFVTMFGRNTPVHSLEQ